MNGRLAVLTAYGEPSELRDYPVPDPESGAILVRITEAGICGSDLHHWRGDFGPRKLPPAGRAMGHEGTGTVARLGSGLETDSAGQPLREGDRVVFSAVFGCGRCQLCVEGLPNLCAGESRRRVGEHPFFVGTFADYAYLPPGHPVFAVPDNLPDHVLPPVNCALATVWNALRVGQARQGHPVVIQGAGGLGLMATALAADMGGNRVIVLDKLANRLELAREFGATDTINITEFPTSRARIDRVKEMTRGLGADLVLEVAGVPDLLHEGTGMLRPGGTLLEIGQIYSRTVEFDPSILNQRGIRIVGVHMYPPGAIPAALDFLGRRFTELPFDRLALHRFALAEINYAFTRSEWAMGVTEVVRGVVVP